MTGGFRLGANGTLEADPYRRAVVRLDDGSDVVYRDVRRFGTWTASRGRRARAVPRTAARRGAARAAVHGRADSVGPLAGRRAPIKSVLLDQRTVAGVGNIYADEALWRARMHPLRPAGEPREPEVRALHRALRAVLRTGLARQGATLRDYRDPEGRTGSMQDEFQVYGRGGEPCRRCRAPIARLRIAGRSSWYCPSCQPAPG